MTQNIMFRQKVGKENQIKQMTEYDLCHLFIQEKEGVFSQCNDYQMSDR